MNNERQWSEDMMMKWEVKNVKTKKAEAYCD